MEKQILLTSLVFIFTFPTKAVIKVNSSLPYTSVKVKSIYPDTVNIIQNNIIAHKEKFQHQELSVLLKALHLTVKSYIIIRPSKPGGPIKGIILSFEDPITVSNKLSSRVFVPSISIYFDNSIFRNQTTPLYSNSQGNWQKAEIDFYGTQLVKDVRVSKRQ